MFLYKLYTEHNFELSLLTPDSSEFDVVWVNPNNIFVEDDGSINYEDNAQLFMPWPSFEFHGLLFKTDYPTFFKGKDNIEYCVCFWPSDYTLEFFVNITTLNEGGTVGNIHDYDDCNPVLEFASNVDDIIDVINHLL